MSLLALFRALAGAAFARAGGGHSFHGGGFHSGGGYHGGGSGGGDVGQLVYLWFELVYYHPFVGVPLTCLVVYVLYKSQGQLQDYRISSTISRGLEAQDDAEMSVALSALAARDPGFSRDAFVARARKAFDLTQAAWGSHDMSKARGFVSDGVMERFAIQIAMQRADGMRNELVDYRIDDARIVELESSASWDVAHVRIQASGIDRDVALEGGAILRAEPDLFAEIWTFARRPSAKTAAGRGALEGSCPNCGTPVPLQDGEQCPSCKSWLNSGEFDWVVCEITQESEWSARESDRDVPGLVAALKTDPALNTRFLEDRASVAFWRWQEALWKGQDKALRAVASDAFCAQLGGDLGARRQFYRDVGVGGVVCLALEQADGLDRAHVIARWSGDVCRVDEGKVDEGSSAYREDVLILCRKSGAQTDARGGLRSLRCPSCGAPPTSRELAACEYCGHKFNDGTRQWVLASVVPASSWRPPEGGAIEPLPAADGAGFVPQDATQPRPSPGFGWAASLSAQSALRVLAAAMMADGEASPDELAYLQDFAQRRGVEPQEVKELLEAARAGQLNVLAPRDAGEAAAFLRGVIAMALADGKVQPAERSAIAACAKAWNLDDGHIDEMIERQRRELYEQARQALAGGGAR